MYHVYHNYEGLRTLISAVHTVREAVAICVAMNDKDCRYGHNYTTNVTMEELTAMTKEDLQYEARQLREKRQHVKRAVALLRQLTLVKTECPMIKKIQLEAVIVADNLKGVAT